MNTALPRVHAGATDRGLLWLEVVFWHDADDEPDAVEVRVPVVVTRWAHLDDRRPERAQVEAARICWDDAGYVGSDGSFGAPMYSALAYSARLQALRSEPWWPADDALIDTWVSAGGPEAMAEHARCAAE